MKMFNSNLTSEQVNQTVDEIFEFEKQLALITTLPEDKRKAEVWYNKMSIREFEELSNRTWLEMLNMLLKRSNTSYRMSQDDKVLVLDTSFYKQINKILEETPTKVNQNYMGWMAVMELVDYLGKEINEAALDYLKVSVGVQKDKERWFKCTNQVNHELAFALSQIYVYKYVKPDSKEKAKEMSDDIRKAFADILANAAWLDEQTRKLAVEKLNSIEFHLVYPDWIFDAQELDKHYNLVNGQRVTRGNYFDSMMLAKEMTNAKSFHQLNKPVNRTME